jgi:hypothetical protein
LKLEACVRGKVTAGGFRRIGCIGISEKEADESLRRLRRGSEIKRLVAMSLS